jgi:hypothetical protein
VATEANPISVDSGEFTNCTIVKQIQRLPARGYSVTESFTVSLSSTVTWSESIEAGFSLPAGASVKGSTSISGSLTASASLAKSETFNVNFSGQTLEVPQCSKVTGEVILTHRTVSGNMNFHLLTNHGQRVVQCRSRLLARSQTHQPTLPARRCPGNVRWSIRIQRHIGPASDGCGLRCWNTLQPGQDGHEMLDIRRRPRANWPWHGFPVANNTADCRRP